MDRILSRLYLDVGGESKTKREHAIANEFIALQFTGVTYYYLLRCVKLRNVRAFCPRIRRAANAAPARTPAARPRKHRRLWIDEWSASALLWRHPHRQQARAPGSLAALRRRCCSCNWSRVHSSSPSPSCRSHHQRRCSCRGHSSHQQLLAPHASKPLRPSVDLKPPRKAAGVMALSDAAIAGTASLLRRRHCRLRRPRRPA